LKQGTLAFDSFLENVAELDLIQLLIAPQTDEHGMGRALSEASNQQQHLHDLGRMEPMGLAEICDGELIGRG
jgi:hypothetical protein